MPEPKRRPPHPRSRRSVDDYRATIDERTEALLEDMENVRVMLGGNRDVSDKRDPAHFANSVLGQLDSIGGKTADLEEKMNVAVTALTDSVKALREETQAELEKLRHEVRTGTVGWHSLKPFLQKNWKWLLVLLFFGYLYARDNDLLTWLAGV